MFKLLIYFLIFWVGTNANKYSNPIAYNAPDPWMEYYKGYYYLLATTWTNELGIRKASTLDGLREVENKIVYTFDGRVLWAPEIHLVDGRWYLFYTACAANTTGGDVCHRNQVAQSASDDPMGPYTFMAILNDPDNDGEELDPSYIIINEKQYLLGSYFPHPQSLYIRPMTNPYTPEGPKHFLSAPTHDWEKQGWAVNEGPEPLYHDGRVFVVYSASGCNTPNYKLGLLEFVGTDPLNSTHWYKYPEPVFQRSDENHVYGPGHNGFFKSPDGTEDWIVYHANINETQGCDMERSSRAQKFTWGNDGLPVFGVPEAISVKYEGPSGE